MHPGFLGKNISDHMGGVLPKQRLIRSQHDAQPLTSRKLLNISITQSHSDKERKPPILHEWRSSVRDFSKAPLRIPPLGKVVKTLGLKCIGDLADPRIILLGLAAIPRLLSCQKGHRNSFSPKSTIIYYRRRRAVAERVIFFDGVCNFCSFWVQFVIRRDPAGKFHFAPLQSPMGREAAQALGLPEEPLQSVILKEGNRYFTQSTASLTILKELTGFWPLLYAFIVVPAPVRNLVYKFIATNRYQWFGKNDSCFVPTPEIRSRFL